VSIPEGGLVEYLWWSQGGLFRSDDDYRVELRKYQDSLIPDDVRDFKGGDELEVRALLGMDVACLHGDKGKDVVEFINELFAWEEEKGGEACVVKASIPTISSAGDLEVVPFGKEGVIQI